MKKVFICALLAGSLGSLCFAQDTASSICNTNSYLPKCVTRQLASNQTPASTQPAFGPVLLPQSGKQPLPLPKAQEDAQPTANVAPAAAQQESLGEIARRYRVQKAQQHSAPAKEVGLQ